MKTLIAMIVFTTLNIAWGYVLLHVTVWVMLFLHAKGPLLPLIFTAIFFFGVFYIAAFCGGIMKGKRQK